MMFDILDEKRAFCTLSTKEAREVFERVLDRKLCKLERLLDRAETRKEDGSDFIDRKEVARMTGYTESTIYTKVSRQEIPVFSRNEPLTFSREIIKRWLVLDKPTAYEPLGKGLYN
jgi:predicted DNA-binding transcriptional regulator AlpA